MPIIDLLFTAAQIGDATVTFDALCLSTDQLGDVVYISGDKIGSYYQVAKVDITTTTKMPAIGIIVQKLTSTTCVVMYSGEVTGLYTGMTPGETMFANSSSQLSETPPGAPTTGIVAVQAIAYSLSSDTIVVKPELPTIRVSG
jgi:hypothetical protein